MTFLSPPARCMPHSRLRAFRVFRTLALALAAAALVACAPAYDWREVKSDAVVALLPAKPDSLTRELELAGLAVKMTMQSARADALSFAIARVDLPAGSDAASRDAVQEALRTALLRNAGRPARPASEAVVAINRTERGAAGVPARSLAVRGEPDGKSIALEARLFARDDHVWQLAVYGPAEAMDRPAAREAVETFMLSTRID